MFGILKSYKIQTIIAACDHYSVELEKKFRELHPPASTDDYKGWEEYWDNGAKDLTALKSREQDGLQLAKDMSCYDKAATAAEILQRSGQMSVSLLPESWLARVVHAYENCCSGIAQDSPQSDNMTRAEIDRAFPELKRDQPFRAATRSECGQNSHFLKAGLGEATRDDNNLPRHIFSALNS